MFDRGGACSGRRGCGGWWWDTRRGLDRVVAGLPRLYHPSCPHPPSPLPLRGRGRIIVFLCKGLRPLHPRGWAGSGTGGGREGGVRRGGGACPWNRARTLVFNNNNSFGKVLGGSGDSFKSPPAYLRISPYLRPPYPPRAPCKKEGTAHEGRFRGMITRRSDRSARCPAPGSSGRRHTG